MLCRGVNCGCRVIPECALPLAIHAPAGSLGLLRDSGRAGNAACDLGLATLGVGEEISQAVGPLFSVCAFGVLWWRLHGC